VYIPNQNIIKNPKFLKMSSWKDDEKHRIIFDIGSHKIRAGVASEKLPQYKIENLAGWYFFYEFYFSSLHFYKKFSHFSP